jgi:hypothetical protein
MVIGQVHPSRLSLMNAKGPADNDVRKSPLGAMKSKTAERKVMRHLLAVDDLLFVFRPQTSR